MAENGARIAKMIAAAGICSRRTAEACIAQGRVRLNGVPVTTPATLVTPADRITVDGKPVAMPSAHTLPRLWRYHKPAGLITSHHDEQGRATVFDDLPPHLPRVISVGRLDLDSEGLLLLTTSGALSRAMELPRQALARMYRVRVNGVVSTKHLHMLAHGVTIDGQRFRPLVITPDSGKTSGRNRWLTVTLREGKNREIRRLFDYFGYPVSRLIRIGYGGFTLDDLAPRAVAEVPAAQVRALMQTLQLPPGGPA